jgi:DNA-binding NtrC family response regulator
MAAASTAVCVLSTHAEFANGLRCGYPTPDDVVIVGSIAEARLWCRQHLPWAVVSDFRRVLQGGHAEDRFLEEIEQLLPQGELVAIIGTNCPEPLERRLACSAIRQVCEPVTGEEVADYLQRKRPHAATEANETPLTAGVAEPARVESSQVGSSQSVATSLVGVGLVQAALTGSDHPGVGGTSVTSIAATGERSDSPTTSSPYVSIHEAPPLSHESDFTLAGLTRSFETNTPKLRMMLADLEVAARHDVTVLLIGETGAGKTFLSRLIHEISPRRNEPFLPVACGALPNDLIESELFGHVRGAFTSAHADKEGKFIAARKGTILLDEIDVLGLEQQVKLLRVIESGEFEQVGSNRTQKCEARLIVASNLDLEPLVEQGKFRPDLYYRLNMLKFELLPLRARRQDIVPLAKKFSQIHSVKHNVRVDRIDDSLFNCLLKYPWPGNVRELEHVIQRAVIYCREGVLTASHLPAHVVMCMAGPGNDGKAAALYPDDPIAQPLSSSLGAQVALSEREIIEQTLFKNNNSRTNTAKALGISRVTLYNKMKKYGMT